MTYPYYNSYTPYIYGYQQPQMVQPIQQPQNVQPMPSVQQTVQQSSTQPNNQLQNGGLVEVRDYSEVQQWPVAPGNVVTFIKYDRSEMYTKTASHNQFEAPVISTFIITRKDEPISPNNSSETPYAMKEDLASLAGVVKELNITVGNVQKDITDMKSDMYGVVGQKKSPVKKEKSSGED